jgi:hypothetical protein
MFATLLLYRGEEKIERGDKTSKRTARRSEKEREKENKRKRERNGQT